VNIYGPAPAGRGDPKFKGRLGTLMKLEEILRMLSSRSLSSNGGFTLRKKYLPEYVPVIDSQLMCGDARAFQGISVWKFQPRSA